MDGDNVGEFRTPLPSYFRLTYIFISTDDEFPKVGSFQVDLSHLADTPALRTLEGPKGTYYEINYSVVLLLGEVELKALVAWKEGVSL